MGYSEQFALSSDTNFVGKVKIAFAKACTDVIGEADPGGNSAAYVKRHEFCTKALNNINFFVTNMVYAVVSDVNITDQSLDVDIQNRVNSLINDFAGVKIGD